MVLVSFLRFFRHRACGLLAKNHQSIKKLTRKGTENEKQNEIHWDNPGSTSSRFDHLYAEPQVVPRKRFFACDSTEANGWRESRSDAVLCSAQPRLRRRRAGGPHQY